MRRMLPVVIGVAVLVSCGDNGATAPAATQPPGASPSSAVVQSSSAPQATTLPKSPTAPSAGASTAVVAAATPEALAFKAPLVGGGELNLADYAGKPVLLWFWAPT
jgi:hypothetical protein